MPQVFVYIRQDDYEKWRAVAKKSEFIHNALNRIPTRTTRGLNEAEIKRGDIIENGTHFKPYLDGRMIPVAEPTKSPQGTLKTLHPKGWSGPITKTFSARKKKGDYTLKPSTPKKGVK